MPRQQPCLIHVDQIQWCLLWCGRFYLTPIAALTLLTPFGLFEVSRLAESDFVGAHLGQTAVYLFGGALLAFALNVTEIMVVAHTSALALTITGMGKMVLVIISTTRRFGCWPLFCLVPRLLSLASL